MFEDARSILYSPSGGTPAAGTTDERRRQINYSLFPRASAILNAEEPPEPPEPLISRAARGFMNATGTIGEALAKPWHGLGMLATAAQESLANPEADIGAAPGSRLRVGPNGEVTSPTLSDLWVEGIRAPAALAQGAYDASKAPGEAIGGNDEITKRGFARGPYRPLAQAEAIAEPIAKMGVQFVTDPVLGGLGALSKAATAGRLTRAGLAPLLGEGIEAGAPAAGILPDAELAAAAQKAMLVGQRAGLAERAIGASFVPGMVAGAVQGARHFMQLGRQEGFTSPEALGAGTSSVIDAAMALLVGKHAATPHTGIPADLRPGVAAAQDLDLQAATGGRERAAAREFLTPDTEAEGIAGAARSLREQLAARQAAEEADRAQQAGFFTPDLDAQARADAARAIRERLIEARAELAARNTLPSVWSGQGPFEQPLAGPPEPGQLAFDRLRAAGVPDVWKGPEEPPEAPSAGIPPGPPPPPPPEAPPGAPGAPGAPGVALKPPLPLPPLFPEPGQGAKEAAAATRRGEAATRRELRSTDLTPEERTIVSAPPEDVSKHSVWDLDLQKDLHAGGVMEPPLHRLLRGALELGEPINEGWYREFPDLAQIQPRGRRQLRGQPTIADAAERQRVRRENIAAAVAEKEQQPPAQVPFVIPKRDMQALADLGYDQAARDRLTPDEARTILAEQRRATPPPPVAQPGTGAPEPAPSPAQMEAGNYQKGHLRWHGMDVSIETQKGGERVAKDGSWRVPNYPADYGYIKGSEGKDGDQVDVFMGDHPTADSVFVVDTVDPKTGKFDEHKAMVGFRDQAHALDTFRRAYSEAQPDERIGGVTRMTPDEFKQWVREGDTKKPLAKQPERAPAAAPETPVREALPSPISRYGQGRIPTDEIPDEAIRKKASDHALKLAKAFAKTGKMDERAFEDLPEDLRPYTQQVRDEAALGAASLIQGRDFLDDLQRQNPEGPDGLRVILPGGVEGDAEALSQPGKKRSFYVFQRRGGKIIGGAQVGDGVLHMIAGGRAFDSPESIRPVYEYLKREGVQRNGIWTLLGAKSDREALADRQRATMEARGSEPAPTAAPSEGGRPEPRLGDQGRHEGPPAGAPEPERAEPSRAARGPEPPAGPEPRPAPSEAAEPTGLRPEDVAGRVARARELLKQAHEQGVTALRRVDQLLDDPTFKELKATLTSLREDKALPDDLRKEVADSFGSMEGVVMPPRMAPVIPTGHMIDVGKGKPGAEKPAPPDLEDVRLSKRLEETLALPTDQAALLVQAGKRVELEKFSSPAEALQKAVLKLAMPADVNVGSIGSIDFLKNALARHPEIIGKKPVTPQVAELPGGGAKYVLPSFATSPGQRGEGKLDFGQSPMGSAARARIEELEAKDRSLDEEQELAALRRRWAASPERTKAEAEAEQLRQARDRADQQKNIERAEKARQATEITVSFKAKPSKAVRDRLKGAGFRWDSRRNVWAARPSGITQQIARSMEDVHAGKVTGLEESQAYAEQWKKDHPEAAEGGVPSTEGVPSPVEEPREQPAEVRTEGVPPNRPAGHEDQGPLGEVPPEDVRRPAEAGEAGPVGVRGGTANAEPHVRPPGPGAEGRPGEGAGVPGVVPPAGRGRPAQPELRSRDADAVRSASDYRIADTDGIGEGTPRRKAQANIEALRILKKIEAEGRSATPAEQAALVKYVGWGGMPQVFDPYGNREWSGATEELKALLTPEEFESARASTPNAHYTSVPVVRGMWEAARRLGLKPGSVVLEPSMGVGHFFGLMPSDLAEGARRTGVELDKTTGRIAQLLYPNARVEVKGFEDVPMPDNFYDLAIGNVPFGNYGIHDPRYKASPQILGSIHNYFFAKALDKVRPGGIVAFITSNSTMDAIKHTAARRYMADRADLVGAIRLPNTAFKGNAATEVTTDILFLQKRAKGQARAGETWEKLEPIKAKGGESLNINEYFARHPDMMLGQMALEGTMYRGGEPALVGKLTPEDLQAAIAKLPEGVIPDYRPNEKGASVAQIALSEVPGAGSVKEGGYVIQKGPAGEPQVLIKRKEAFEPTNLRGKAIERIQGMLGVRDQVREVFRTQLADAPEKDLAAARTKLNRAYDAFVKKHGPLWSRSNRLAFNADPDAPLLLSLEDYNPETGKATKTAVFSKRTIERYEPPTTAGSASEALAVTLNERGRIDWIRMQDLTGKTPAELQEELGDLAFHDPEGREWKTNDEYLSGNVRHKLAVAEAAAKADPTLARNVEALRKVQPKDLGPGDVRARLGASWIPKEDVSDFVGDLLGAGQHQRRNIGVSHSDAIATWTLRLPWDLKGSVANTDKWGTKSVPAHELIEDALNLKTPTVYDTHSDGSRTVNTVETEAAREAQGKIKDEFSKWVWKDPKRADRLLADYNRDFNNTRLRQYDGSHLKLPGMSRLTLRDGDLAPHQKNAVWRTLQSGGNTLLGHVVGAGKTFEMVAAGMEAKRMGLSRKPMYVVPNHLVEQWGAEFLRLYPSANIMVAGKESFLKGKRQETAARIATGNYDAVILSHKSFEALPISDQTFQDHMNARIQELESHILEVGEAEGKSSRIVKELEKAKKRLEKKIKDRANRSAKDKTVSFEELGVDSLYVDEAHAYKNLWFPTRMSRVAGIPNSESNRAFDMYMKTQYLTKLNGGRGVVFATGTPISNTMAEMFNLQRYLQPEDLARQGMSQFDAWAGNYGEVVHGYELAPDGSGYRVHSRFSRFVNLPELLQSFRQVADIQTADMLNLPRPKIVGGKQRAVPAKATQALKDYVASLVARAEKIRSGRVDPREDNMLKITSDGAKAALDMRLVDPTAPDNPESKVNLAVNRIAEVYHETTPKRSTQLVFLDLSTPKPKGERGKAFSVYEDVRQKLIDKGVDPKEIEFIHDAETDAQKKALFDAVNAGRVRVLMGSTEKMGVGMNVQRLLKAEHHLDAPWRPSDIEQREGRILRQGNENPEVEINRYVTEGSFDAYRWQTLENKARFIDQVMKGDLTVREAEDVDSSALTYAEVKAIASGNPLVLEKVKVDTELRKLDRLLAHHEQHQLDIQRELGQLPSSLTAARARLARHEADLERLAQEAKKEQLTIQVGDKTYGTADKDEAAAAGEALRAKIQGIPETAPGTSPASYPVGAFAGFDIRARRNPFDTRTQIVDGQPVEVQGDKRDLVLQSRDTGESYPIDFRPDEQPKTTLRHVAEVADVIELRKSGAQGEIARAEERIKALRDEAGKPFEYTDRVKELTQQQKDITSKLDLDKSDKQAEAQEFKEQEEPEAGVEAPEGAEGEAPDVEDYGSKALDRLKARGRGGKAYSLAAAGAEGPAIIKDAAIYGASLIHKGLRRFADWSERMVTDLGSFISDLGKHLRRIFSQSVERAASTPPPAKPPVTEAAPAGGGPPAPRKTTAEALFEDSVTASNAARKLADSFTATNRKFEIAQEGAERVAERGTIEKGVREEFRGEGQPAPGTTEHFLLSEARIKEAGAQLVEAVRQFKDAERHFNEAADPTSAHAMRLSRQIMEQAVKNWQVYRTAAGRAVKTFDRPIPQDVIDRLNEAGMIAGNIRNVRARAPIASNILESLKHWDTLNEAEKKRFARDLVDHFRLNLFSVTSWTLDAIGNAAELAGQAGAGVGHDLVQVVRGNPTFPSLQGAFRAIRANPAFKELAPDVEHALETTVSGERLKKEAGQGVFTYRKGLGSKLYDYGVGLPLYWKGFFDTAAKRMGALWTLNRDAIEAAREKGLQGADREQFIERWLVNPPPESLARAMSNGKKAGFNRDLSRLEENIANSTTARLLVDSFARWPFQFTRWAAEMLGFNPELWHKFRAGSLRAEDVGEYLGKAAVGIGGLMLINGMYNRVDFNSMEYVDKDGNRIRLSNRDPIPTALWLLAVIKAGAAEASGDKKARDQALAKATASLQNASIPGARLLSGQGGLLGGTIKAFLTALENPQNDPRALRKELEDTINRAIPGQALLSALKTAFDPTLREGVGAQLPGVSLALPPVINPVTGQPLQSRQRVPGVPFELPAIGGTPIPGATRIIEPVQKLLARFGLLVYRGPRSPIAGYPPGQVPEEMRTEWQQVFGEARNRLLSPLVRYASMQNLGEHEQESIRKKIQERDRIAAEMANREMRRRHGGPRKLPRQEGRREMAAPDIFQERRGG